MKKNNEKQLKMIELWPHINKASLALKWLELLFLVF